MESKLVFVHLSDIHFRSRHSSGPHDLDEDLRNELERDVQRMVEKVGHVTGILVTGDVAYSGRTEEYDMARQWLCQLCDLAGCPAENVWTVPGNHDVNRERIEQSKILRAFRQELRTVDLTELDERLQEWLTDRSAPELLTSLQEYVEFAIPFECGPTVERLSWQSDLFLNDGTVLRLLGLNSALVSDRFDNDGENKLVLGSAQCRLERQDGVEYLILCHHPPQWLRDEDKFTDHVNSRSRLQLFGHKHRQRVYQVNDTLRLFAGALHPDRRETGWEPRYNLLAIHVDGDGSDRRLVVELYGRLWTETGTRFVADRDEDGHEVRTYSFKVPSWKTPVRSIEAELETVEAPAESGEREAAGKRHGVQGKEMEPTRRLTYRFLTLPYRKRLQIAIELGLLEDPDRGIPEPELYKRFFHRARSRNLLAELWDAVEKQYGGSASLENPFRTSP